MVFTYGVIPGFFVEGVDNDKVTLEQISPIFGLIDSSPTCWDSFKTKIAELNQSAPKDTTYRVLFVGRHGQGYHNVAESLYGSKEWNSRWAKLNGDGKIIWGPDPLLTEMGIKQAKVVNKAWKEQTENGMPLPESLYSSPFTRAAHTALLTFDGILIGVEESIQKRPVIKEKLREVNGVHTCDKRSPRSHILKMFPQFDIEPGFSEEDELWDPNHRETEAELTVRLGLALDEIFIEDSNTYISLTIHGGAARALMRVVGAQPHQLPTGGVVCLVVKVTKV